MTQNNTKNHSKKDASKGNNKKKQRNGIFWGLMSLFSLLLVGIVTFAMCIYEGSLLRKTIKENRAELIAEFKRKKTFNEKIW